MLRDVYLYGAPGKQFGRHFRIDVETPHEAIRALETLRPGSRQVFRQGEWRLIVGTPRIRNSVTDIDMHLGNLPLHIVPCTRPHGGDGGFGKVALGIVTIGAAIALSPFTMGGSLTFAAAMATPSMLGMSFGSIALMGGSMVLGGVASLLSPKPPQQVGATSQATDMARPEDRPSFLFNGAVNNTQQGGPVPLVIGMHLTGSVVISGALLAEDVPT